MELPTCQCVAELPLAEKAAAIYGAFRQLAGDPAELAEYDCVRGLPLEQIFDKIYCAAAAWAATL